MMEKEIHNSMDNAVAYLKKVINFSGIALVTFLLIFIICLLFTQCSKKDYTNSLSQIERVASYHKINNLVIESQGQIMGNLIVLNNNAEAIQQYLNRDVKSQFDNVSSSISSLNNQISTLYTLFNNLLMIISIILGIFTVIIAVLGFYISKVIEAKYEIIRRSKEEVETLKNEINLLVSGKSRELFNKIQELDTENLLNSLKDNPLNIGNIISTLNNRNISGEKYWNIIKDAYMSLEQMYPGESGNYSVICMLALVFQFYPHKVVSGTDKELLKTLKRKSVWMNQISFFPNEYVRLIDEFEKTDDDELISLFNSLVLQNQSFTWYLTGGIYTKNLTDSLKEAYANNNKIRKLVDMRKDKIQKQYDILYPNQNANNIYQISLYKKELDLYNEVTERQ